MNNLQFLVVDDDVEFLESIQMILASKGNVTTASSLKDACQILCKKTFDALVVDYHLVDGNGCELIRTLKENSSKETPTILMSGFASKEMAIEALDLRVMALLEKPFSATQLLEKVNKVLKINSQPELILNSDLRCAIVNGEKIDLTATEFKLLSLLTENKNKQIEREQIEINLWGKSAVSKNTLDTHLYNLKKKIPNLKEKIKTIHGAGLIYYS